MFYRVSVLAKDPGFRDVHFYVKAASKTEADAQAFLVLSDLSFSPPVAESGFPEEGFTIRVEDVE